MTEQVKIPQRPWRVVLAGCDVKVDKFIISMGPYVYTAEDNCIVDAEGFEVVGCSEWMRGSEWFEYICKCVNNAQEEE